MNVPILAWETLLSVIIKGSKDNKNVYAIVPTVMSCKQDRRGLDGNLSCCKNECNSAYLQDGPLLHAELPVFLTQNSRTP